MNILRNFFNFRQGKQLNLNGFKLNQYSKTINLETSTIGTYGKLGIFVLGYFIDQKGELQFFVNDTVQAINSEFKIEFTEKSKTSKLKVQLKNKVIFEISYKPKYSPISTLSYTEHEEDADYGLWLANVFNSKERISVIKETTTNYSKQKI